MRNKSFLLNITMITVRSCCAF